MKTKIISSLLIVSSFFFAFCGNSEAGKEKTDSIKKVVTEQANTEKTELLKGNEFIEIEGIYVKGGHDNSYAMDIFLEESGEYAARFANIDGMLPPANMFTEIKFEIMPNFKVNLKQRTFTSDAGNGKFTGNLENQKVVFTNKKDFMDDPLILEPLTD